jgi:hypothetical protein
MTRDGTRFALTNLLPQILVASVSREEDSNPAPRIGRRVLAESCRRVRRRLETACSLPLSDDGVGPTISCRGRGFPLIARPLRAALETRARPITAAPVTPPPVSSVLSTEQLSPATAPPALPQALQIQTPFPERGGAFWGKGRAGHQLPNSLHNGRHRGRARRIYSTYHHTNSDNAAKVCAMS